VRIDQHKTDCSEQNPDRILAVHDVDSIVRFVDAWGVCLADVSIDHIEVVAVRIDGFIEGSHRKVNLLAGRVIVSLAGRKLACQAFTRCIS
jgi:hypothetical protein